MCSQKSLEELIKEQYPTYKDKTVHNAVYQLRRTLKESPIGEFLGQYNEINKDTFQRGRYEELSPESVAYSLYKYADARKIYNLRVHDFYKNEATAGPLREFCLPKSDFEGALRTLNSNKNRVLVAELNMGLDSITLREDLTPITALKSLLEI
jgi:phosphoadenosine phosphosulfate reductase